jgi:hypothetical protein
MSSADVFDFNEVLGRVEKFDEVLQLDQPISTGASNVAGIKTFTFSCASSELIIVDRVRLRVQVETYATDGAPLAGPLGVRAVLSQFLPLAMCDHMTTQLAGQDMDSIDEPGAVMKVGSIFQSREQQDNYFGGKFVPLDNATNVLDYDNADYAKRCNGQLYNKTIGYVESKLPSSWLGGMGMGFDLGAGTPTLLMGGWTNARLSLQLSANFRERAFEWISTAITVGGLAATGKVINAGTTPLVANALYFGIKKIELVMPKLKIREPKSGMYRSLTCQNQDLQMISVTGTSQQSPVSMLRGPTRLDIFFMNSDVGSIGLRHNTNGVGTGQSPTDLSTGMVLNATAGDTQSILNALERITFRYPASNSYPGHAEYTLVSEADPIAEGDNFSAYSDFLREIVVYDRCETGIDYATWNSQKVFTYNVVTDGGLAPVTGQLTLKWQSGTAFANAQLRYSKIRVGVLQTQQKLLDLEMDKNLRTTIKSYEVIV